MNTKLIDIFIDVYDNIVKYIVKNCPIPDGEITIKCLYTNNDEESGMRVTYYITDVDMKRIEKEMNVPINQILLRTMEEEISDEYYKW